MASANFSVNEATCVGCGLCLEACPGNMVGGDVLRLVDGRPVMVDQNKYGWQGCWRCQHCLAACPTGSISIFGLSAGQLSPKPDASIAEDLPKLVRFRRSCRAFKKDDVDEALIDELLDDVSAVPTGGNNQRLEFSVVTSREAMRRVYDAVFSDPAQPGLFETEADDLSALRIYDAPHLFIAHKELGGRNQNGDAVEVNLATAYFELLANARGLGTVISTYSAELLSQHPEALELLGIPENHSFMTVVGFGYPRIRYVRGIAKKRPVHKLS